MLLATAAMAEQVLTGICCCCVRSACRTPLRRLALTSPTAAVQVRRSDACSWCFGSCIAVLLFQPSSWRVSAHTYSSRSLDHRAPCTDTSILFQLNACMHVIAGQFENLACCSTAAAVPTARGSSAECSSVHQQQPLAVILCAILCVLYTAGPMRTTSIAGVARVLLVGIAAVSWHPPAAAMPLRAAAMPLHAYAS